MAEVEARFSVVLKLTDKEYKLVGLALACKLPEFLKEEAAKLNRQLLEQKQRFLQHEMEKNAGTMQKAGCKTEQEDLHTL